MFLRLFLTVSLLVGCHAMHAVDIDSDAGTEPISQDDASTVLSCEELPKLTQQELADFYYNSIINQEIANGKKMPYKNMAQVREFVDGGLGHLELVYSLGDQDIHPVAGSLYCALCFNAEIAKAVVRENLDTFKRLRVAEQLIYVMHKDDRAEPAVNALFEAKSAIDLEDSTDEQKHDYRESILDDLD